MMTRRSWRPAFPMSQAGPPAVRHATTEATEGGSAQPHHGAARVAVVPAGVGKGEVWKAAESQIAAASSGVRQTSGIPQNVSRSKRD